MSRVGNWSLKYDCTYACKIKNDFKNKKADHIYHYNQEVFSILNQMNNLSKKLKTKNELLSVIIIINQKYVDDLLKEIKKLLIKSDRLCNKLEELRKNKEYFDYQLKIKKEYLIEMNRQKEMIKQIDFEYYIKYYQYQNLILYNNNIKNKKKVVGNKQIFKGKDMKQNKWLHCPTIIWANILIFLNIPTVCLLNGVSKKSSQFVDRDWFPFYMRINPSFKRKCPNNIDNERKYFIAKFRAKQLDKLITHAEYASIASYMALQEGRMYQRFQSIEYVNEYKYITNYKPTY